MKKFIFNFLLLSMSTTIFAQRIEWYENSNIPEKGAYTYVDSTTLVYNSGDGKLNYTYQLLYDGRTLNYEINVNLPTSSTNYWFFSGAYVDDYMGDQFWNLDYPIYTFGMQTYTGSVYLDYSVPTPIGLHTGIETTSTLYELWGGLIFATYYPPN